MKNIRKDREFYSLLIRIAIPIAMQNLITFGINMLDTVMLGKLGSEAGEIAISASKLANEPFFIFTIITYGLAGASTVLVSQYWGKKDMESIRKILGIALRCALIVSIIFSVIVLVFSEQVLGLFTKDADIIKEGVKYLKIIGFSYIFFGITNTFLSAIRSIEIVKISVVIQTISLCSNFILNWLFIFGNLGAPRLEIQGAALATLITRINEFIIVLVFAFIIDRKLKFKPKYILKKDKILFKNYFKYGTPVILNEMFWALAISFQTAILGHIGKEVTAASTIASLVNQMATVFVFGVANAAAVIVGKNIGEGRLKKARQSAYTLNLLSIIIGILAALTIFFARKSFVDFYDLSETTRQLAMNILIIVAITSFFMSVSATGIIGTFRGAGDTLFTLIAEIGSLWLVSIPLGLIAFFTKMPAVLVFAFLKLDEPVKAIACQFRLRSKSWIKDVT